MTAEGTDRAIPRSRLSLGVDPRLQDRLASLAAGRALVIDYFTSQRCGPVFGDLVVRWRDGRPGPDHVELAPIDGVPVFVHERLVDVLIESEPKLHPGGILRRDRPSIHLARPERWFEFLDSATARASASSE